MPKSVHLRRCGARLRGQRGFTLIDLLFVIAIIGLLCAMVLPQLTRARGVAQAASALGTLRTVNSAQLTYAITCGLGFYAPDLPTLGVIPPSSFQAFLTEDLASAATVIKSGFRFTMTATPLAGAPPTCNGLGVGMAAPSYVLLGEPLDPLFVKRFFASNADGIIYEDVNSLDGVMPESGAPVSGAPIQ